MKHMHSLANLQNLIPTYICRDNYGQHKLTKVAIYILLLYNIVPHISAQRFETQGSK